MGGNSLQEDKPESLPFYSCSPLIQRILVFGLCIGICFVVAYAVITKDFWSITAELPPMDRRNPGVGLLFLVLLGGSCMSGISVGYLLALIVWYRVLKRP
jgi:hypothetical protein